MSVNLPTDFLSRPVAVIGAGALGRRIALMFAAHGAEVQIYDPAEHQRRAAVAYVSDVLPALADQLNGVVPGRVSATADLGDAVDNAWLVIEAVPERLELKRQVFGQ
jgi:3-hydroxybutyryl-CoA dehydrogenase